MEERTGRAPAYQQSGDKQEQLEGSRVDYEGSRLATNFGVRIEHTDDSLKVSGRGPTLMEDFHFREKLTHFDHERIPERVVHARGAGAYGHFRVYDDSLADFTCAEFLTNPDIETDVFVRFSTVVGSRGSADTVRDVRGFASKFYTRQGNFDLVGNNIPVFFIQDGIKFPDLIHAVKPEPDSEIPQAQSAHDTFWDFAGLLPEIMHMLMWHLSDRAIPRSFRMMQGFGVHTFRLVSAEGRGTFVKFHWTPVLGVHSLVWEEAQQLAGKDPDFHRRDLWDAIESGNYPEYELGIQLVSESDEHAFDFDLLDATKIIPEEQVPLRPVGRLVLDRNPDNFFAETEQVAFHTAHVVPGIDFTNDPLLQARNFSYLDTQLIRLGGPNFEHLPINRPVTPVTNNQRDGYHRTQIDRSRTSYSPNSLGGGCPALADWSEGGYVHLQERVDGQKVRTRSESFRDHYSQARMFWLGLTDWERDHLVAAGVFELGKCKQRHVKERVVEHFGVVHPELGRRVAAGLGLPPPSGRPPEGVKTGRLPSEDVTGSPAVSQSARAGDGSIRTRKVAVLVADGYEGQVVEVVRRLTEAGAVCVPLSTVAGPVASESDNDLGEALSMLTDPSVVFDAVLVAGGTKAADKLRAEPDVLRFVTEAFRHGKPIGATGAGVDVLAGAGLDASDLATDGEGPVEAQGVVTTRDGGEPSRFVEAFAAAIARHRFHNRAAPRISA